MAAPDRYLEVLNQHLAAENAHDLEGTLATLTADCLFEDLALAKEFRGYDGAARYYEMWWGALSTEVVPERLHWSDQTAIAETTWRGTHVGAFGDLSPSGRQIEIPVAVVIELRDGLIAGERLYWDRARLHEQLHVALAHQ